MRPAIKDPTYAIGFRLGLPHAESFVLENLSDLSDARGAAFARDMVAVTGSADIHAARRICEALCPGAALTLKEDETGVRVSYASGDVSGTVTLTKSEVCEAMPAHALVSAAIGLEHRLARNAVVEDIASLDEEGLRLKAVELLAWSKTIHRPGSRVHVGLDGMERRLARPDASLGYDDGEVSPQEVAAAFDPVTRDGDLGKEIDAVVDRLDALGPAMDPRA